ncbi:MAG: serine hydrolase [Pseudomonadota bacterium]
MQILTKQDFCTARRALRAIALGVGALALAAPALTLAGAPENAASTASAPGASAQIEQLMARYHELGQLDGTVLVADHGKVVYQGAFGLANREWSVPNTVDTAHRIASMSKQFTATLIMQLQEQGKLRLDDKVSKYVPDLKPEIGERVTIHQLLNHTSGIVDFANFPGFWANRMGERVTRADMLAIMNHDLEFAPGTSRHYSSSGYTLLGYIIEKQTGKTYDLALEDMILRPLGMTRSGFDAPERVVERKASGYARVLGSYQPAAPVWTPNILASGGMYSTVGDLLRWDRALYGQSLLSDQSKRLMFTPYVQDDVWGDLGYGYGWMIGQRELGGKARLVHEHGGNGNGNRSLITRYPDEQRLVVILLNEGGGYNGPGIYRIRNSITQVLYDMPAPLPKAGLSEALMADINTRGLAPAVADFAALQVKFGAPTSVDDLPRLGYAYAFAKRYDAAIAIFKLNLMLFPTDGNTYDSMGEVNLMADDKPAAIVNYRRALELDPKNTNAAEVLRKLGAR